MSKNTKQYIGDAVYVDVSIHGDLVLTTENGVSISNTIVLEVEVWRALCEYVRQSRFDNPEFDSSEGV